MCTTAATELARISSGVKRPGLPKLVRDWSRMGSRKTTPTKAAMAPAVCRMITPSPSPNRPKRARKAPDNTSARRTPGCPMRGGRRVPREDRPGR